MCAAKRLLAVLAIALGGWSPAESPVPRTAKPGSADAAALRDLLAIDMPRVPRRFEDAENRFQRMPPVAARTKLAAAIARGETFRVTFDQLPAAEPLGMIRRGAVLTGFYVQATEAWEMWSPHHPERPHHHFVYSPAGPPGRGFIGIPIRPDTGRLCLWGGIIPFDDRGTVYHPQKPTIAIGRLELVP